MTDKRRDTDTNARHTQGSVAALPASPGYMRQILEASPEGVVLVDVRDETLPIVYVNAAFERITGYDRDEVIGENPDFLQAGDEQADIMAAIQQAHDNQEPLTVMLRNYRKDGSMFWNDLHLSPLFDDSGEVTHFIGIQHDVTEHEKRREALEESEDRFQRLLAISPGGIVVHRDNLIVYANQTMRTMMALPDDEPVAGKDIMAFVHEDYHQDVQERILYFQATADHMAGFSERILIREDGTQFYAETTSRRIMYEGQPALLTVIYDITERKAFEEKLFHERHLLNVILDNLPLDVFVKDTESRFLMANASTMQSLRVTDKQEYIGKTDFDFMPQKLDQAQQHFEDEQRIVRTGEPMLNRNYSGGLYRKVKEVGTIRA